MREDSFSDSYVLPPETYARSTFIVARPKLVKGNHSWHPLFWMVKKKRRDTEIHDHPEKHVFSAPLYGFKDSRTKSIEFKEPLVTDEFTAKPWDDENLKGEKKVPGDLQYLEGMFAPEITRFSDDIPFVEEVLCEKDPAQPSELINREDTGLPYSYEELEKFHEKIAPLTSNRKLPRVSELLARDTNFKEVETGTMDTSTVSRKLAIIEKKIKCDHPRVRCIGHCMLVGVGAFTTPFSTYVHFDRDFCSIMIYAIDNLTIYTCTDMLPIVQFWLVEVGACFIWEQWISSIQGTEYALEALRRLTKAGDSQLLGIEVHEKSTASDANFQQFKNDLNEYIDTAAKQESDDVLPAAGDISRVNSITAVDVKAEEVVNRPSSSRGPIETLSMIRMVDDAKAKDQKGESQIKILPHSTTFQLLCNMYIGTPLLRVEIRERCTFKLTGLFRACVRRSSCGQHTEMIPLIYMSIKSTRRKQIRAFFYDLLLIIVAVHLECCLEPADLFAPNSQVRTLVSDGLQPLQHVSIQEIAVQIKTAVSTKYPDVRIWGTSVVAETNTEAAPGGWNWHA